MFKRVSRRARKREKETELGLDEEAKQVLGLQDTDSDESLDSNSDSESDNSDVDSDEEIDDEGMGLAGHVSHQQKRPAHRLDSSVVSGALDEESYPESELSDADEPPMSVMSATIDPIYDLSSGASLTMDLRACIICPGKLIKNPQMAKTHVESKAHCRRLQRYTAEVSRRASNGKGLGTDDPRHILRDMSGGVDYGAPLGTSKRFQRRTQRKDRMEDRRKQKKKRHMLIDASKEVVQKITSQGKPIKERAKKRSPDIHTRPDVSVTVESSCAPDVADGQEKDSSKSELLDRNVDDSQRARPKKRQRREACETDITSLPESRLGSHRAHTERLVELPVGKKGRKPQSKQMQSRRTRKQSNVVDRINR